MDAKEGLDVLSGEACFQFASCSETSSAPSTVPSPSLALKGFVHYLPINTNRKSEQLQQQFSQQWHSGVSARARVCAHAHMDACLHTRSTYADFSGYHSTIRAWSLEPRSVFEVLTHLPMYSLRIQVPCLII